MSCDIGQSTLYKYNTIDCTGAYDVGTIQNGNCVVSTDSNGVNTTLSTLAHPKLGSLTDPKSMECIGVEVYPPS